MVVNFMGLIGPLGVLALLHHGVDRGPAARRDRTLLDFLNIFNHRMISLFYQAWEKYRFTIAYERGEQRPVLASPFGPDRAWQRPDSQNRQNVPTMSLLFYYAGLFALHARIGHGAARQILADYFESRWRVEQFVGAWYPLGTSISALRRGRSRIPSSSGSGRWWATNLGPAVAACAFKLGPLTIEHIAISCRTGARSGTACHCAVFQRQRVEFEVQLILKREEVPACELNRRRWSAASGWRTWVKSAAMFDGTPAIRF